MTTSCSPAAGTDSPARSARLSPSDDSALTETAAAVAATGDDRDPAGDAHQPALVRTRWGALLVMMATSFVLVTAEFLPSGLLTPMAADLGVTPGRAAWTVTVTALVGFVAAPTVGLLIPRLDRRTLLAVLTLAAALSNLVVAIAPSLWLMLLSRTLLGAALSGFWAMSLAASIRMSRPEQLGRAIMIVTAGGSLATVAGVPAGVLLGDHLGWRAAFVAMAVVTAVVAALLVLVLPAIPASPAAGLRQLGATLTRTGVPLGLTGHVLVVLGHFTAFAFVRVALERLDGVSTGEITLLLALFGVGGLVGNLIIGLLVDRHLPTLAFAVPLLTAVSIATVAEANSVTVVAAAVLLWGSSFGGWLILVNAWISRRLSDSVEAGGGLVVAGFQLSIMLGSAGGGLLIDGPGVTLAYGVAAVIVAVGVVAFGSANRGLRAPGQ